MDLQLAVFSNSDFKVILEEITSRAELVQWAGSKRFSYPLDEKQLTEYLLDASSDKSISYIYSLIRSDDKVLIGHVELSDIDWKNMTAVLSRVLIFKKYRGRGYSHHLLQAILNQAFDILKLKKIKLSVYTFNTPAIACYKK